MSPGARLVVESGKAWRHSVKAGWAAAASSSPDTSRVYAVTVSLYYTARLAAAQVIARGAA